VVNDTRTEYAIEVPDRGYIANYPAGYDGKVTRDPNQASVCDNPHDALERLKTSMGKYTSMGCPEIATTLRIVSRTATLTYSDWVALEVAVAE
jgi:hypothetical protein